MATKVFNVYRTSDKTPDEFLFSFHDEEAARDFLDEHDQDYALRYTIESGFVWDTAQEYRTFLDTGRVDTILRPGDRVKLQLLGEEVTGVVEAWGEGEYGEKTWLKIRTDKGATLRQVKDLQKV